MSQTESFLNYIKIMDIDMIEKLLKDDCICFGATKETFINSLRDKYNIPYFKDKKITCNVNKYKNKKDIYSFAIYPSFKKIKIQIREKNGVITELKNFYKTITEDDYAAISIYDLYFFEDERIGFKPTAEYLFLKSECEAACKEIDRNIVKTLTPSVIKEWIFNYKDVYKLVKDNYLFRAYNDFQNEYFCLYSEFININYAKYAKKAIEEYQTFISEWYNKWSDLSIAPFVVYNTTEHLPYYIIDMDNKIFQASLFKNRYYCGEEFVDLIKFKKILDKLIFQ